MKKKLSCALLAAGAATLGTVMLGLAPAAAQPAQQAPLSILRTYDADRYDPVRSTATAAAEVLYLLADTLLSVDFDMKTVKPLLAESWTVSPDGKTYTFKLRQDVKFCDGRAMTADDVVYSFKRLIDPAAKSPVAFRAGPVKDIRATDAATVVYELDAPYSDLLFQLTLPFTSVVDKHAVEKLGQNFGVQGFNGTGPYCWGNWTPRQDFTMTRNPHYTWGPAFYKNPAPQIEKIVWRIIPESNTLMAALQSKQADISYYVPNIAIESLKRLPGITVAQQQNYIYDVFVGFRVDKPVASDPVVRRAANMAINKEAITKAVYFGQGKVLQSLLNPSVVDFDPGSLAVMPKYDVPGAIKLLDEAKWQLGSDGIREKDGQKASFTLYGIRNDENSRMVEAMQTDLRKIGIEMKVQLWDGTVAWGKLATQEFDAFIMAYPYVTANEALSLYFKSTQAPTPNRMNWKNAETDAQIAIASTATDETTRKDATAALQRQLTEANVWIPISARPLWLVSTDRVEGARVHGVYGAGLYKGLDLKLKR